MRIAAIVEDDAVWSVPAWERAIPGLRAHGHDVVGLWTCPARLGRHLGRDIPLWYLRTFGPLDTCRLAIFSILVQGWRRATGRPCSMADLGQRCGIPVQAAPSPNAPELVEWLRGSDVDIGVIMLNHVVKPVALEACRLGMINKHAAMLPSFRGLFPHFWAKTLQAPQGVSFHVVAEALDSGSLLVQDPIPDGPATASMLAFYVHVFKAYADGLVRAVEALAAGRFIAPPADIQPSYYGLPTATEMSAAKRKGFQISRWRDLCLAKDIARP